MNGEPDRDRDGSARQPAANQPGGPDGPSLEYENGSRGPGSGKNLEDNRAIGVPETPFKPEDVGQLPDGAGEKKIAPDPRTGGTKGA